MSSAVAVRAEVVDELLRRAASLALGRLETLLARRRRWPCATVACAHGRGPARSRPTGAWGRSPSPTFGASSRPWRAGSDLVGGAGRFDLADSVAARLLRHEFASEALRAFARGQGALREDALAARAGFDGAADDVHCSDPQALSGQSAVFLVEPPPLETSQDDYRTLITRLTAGGRLSGRASLSTTLADALTTIATAGAGRLPSHESVARVAFYAPSLEVSAAVPNPFTRRALDDAWVAALCVRCRRPVARAWGTRVRRRPRPRGAAWT